MLAIWSLIPLPFLKPAWTSGSSGFTYCWSLPGLENFEHYFTSMWDEHKCAVVWTFFGTAFLWDWMKTDLFQSCDHCWVLQICWHIECSTFTASSFRIWNSSTGISSPPLALFVVMLSKAHLTSHSRMSGSRWVITSSWLSGCNLRNERMISVHFQGNPFNITIIQVYAPSLILKKLKLNGFMMTYKTF